MMLKSTKSTLPSLLRSADSGGEDRLYQYAVMEKSTRLTLPSVLVSPRPAFFGSVHCIFFLLTKNPITDDEYKTLSTSLNDKTFNLAAKRQTYYRNHYENTLKLVSEILRALAHKTIDLYKKNAI